MNNTFVAWYRQQAEASQRRVSPILLRLYERFLNPRRDVSSISDLSIAIVSGVEYANNQEEAVMCCRFNLMTQEEINRRILPLFQ